MMSTWLAAMVMHALVKHAHMQGWPHVFLGCEHHLQVQHCPTSLCCFARSSPCIRENWRLICYWLQSLFVNTKSKLFLSFFLLLRLAVWPDARTCSLTRTIYELPAPHTRCVRANLFRKKATLVAPLDQNWYPFLPLLLDSHDFASWIDGFFCNCKVWSSFTFYNLLHAWWGYVKCLNFECMR